MATPGPLQELLLHFRGHENIPDSWVRKLSTTGDLDEAAARAWETEPDARPMTQLAPYFADRKALALVAADFGRMLLDYLPEKKQAVPRKALDFVEKWATEPGIPEPKQGWLALADSVEPADDKDDLPTYAAQSIATALTTPGYPMALPDLSEAVIDRKTEELMASEGGLDARRTELEVEAIENRAEQQLRPLMAERVRARIPAPAGATLLEALKQKRSKDLSDALSRKNKAQIKAFQPD
ncbi:MAG TPA: hypothetical protein VFH73_28865 [Polyangia bacterium]|jgi:hypothetical protein|nr:hypothetical protein [Polyangia bacterium]